MVQIRSIMLTMYWISLDCSGLWAKLDELFHHYFKNTSSSTYIKRTIQTQQLQKGLSWTHSYSCHLRNASTNAEKYIEILEQHILIWRCHYFHRSPAFVNQTLVINHTLQITKVWGRRGYWIGLPAVITCFQQRMCEDFWNATMQTVRSVGHVCLENMVK